MAARGFNRLDISKEFRVLILEKDWISVIVEIKATSLSFPSTPCKALVNVVSSVLLLCRLAGEDSDIVLLIPSHNSSTFQVN